MRGARSPAGDSVRRGAPRPRPGPRPTWPRSTATRDARSCARPTATARPASSRAGCTPSRSPTWGSRAPPAATRQRHGGPRAARCARPSATSSCCCAPAAGADPASGPAGGPPGTLASLHPPRGRLYEDLGARDCLLRLVDRGVEQRVVDVVAVLVELAQRAANLVVHAVL